MRAGLLDRPLTLMAVCSWDLKNNDYCKKQDRSDNSKDEEMNIKIPFTGGCSCGAIRYESTAEPIMMFKCHCRDCQQATGGAFVPGMLLSRGAFRFTRGQLRYHFTHSLRGGKRNRAVCPECGGGVRGGGVDGRECLVIGIVARKRNDPGWLEP